MHQLKQFKTQNCTKIPEPNFLECTDPEGGRGGGGQDPPGKAQALEILIQILWVQLLLEGNPYGHMLMT